MNPFSSPAHEASCLKTQWENGIVPMAHSLYLKGSGNHAVLMLHGFTSSPKEFVSLAGRLNEKGINISVPLLPGHGTSPLDLLHVKRTDWIDCAEKAFADLRAHHESVSIVGFSLGGALALHLAAHLPVARLALVAPWIKIYDEHIVSSEFLAYTLGYIFRWQRKETAGNINDPAGLENHFAYYHFPLSAVREAIRLSRRAKRLAAGIKCPLLLEHSTGDRTIDFRGSEWLYRKIGSPQKEFLKLSTSNHIVFYDYEKQEAENRIADFLLAR